MIDIYIDDMKCTEIISIKEGYRIDFKNSKDEKMMIVLNEENFVDLFNRMKRRCETLGLTPIYNALEPAENPTAKMTAQEAINVLGKYAEIPKSETVKTAYRMAISALNRQTPDWRVAK